MIGSKPFQKNLMNQLRIWIKSDFALKFQLNRIFVSSLIAKLMDFKYRFKHLIVIMHVIMFLYVR